MAQFKPVSVKNRFKSNSSSDRHRNMCDDEQDLLSRIGCNRKSNYDEKSKGIDMTKFNHSGMSKRDYNLHCSYNQMQRRGK